MEAAFKAINDVTRREILQFLIQGPQNAGQIAKQFDMTTNKSTYKKHDFLYFCFIPINWFIFLLIPDGLI
jgi:DNA-binding transcriptional ArsR family regulator